MPTMAITYYKRFRMEIDLRARGRLRAPRLEAPFAWVPWAESLMMDHAEVKYQAFHNELDSLVFPCLSDRSGCQRLMREIRRKPGFLPEATWLIDGPDGYCGTIQGVVDRGTGSIQNVGIVPEYRGRGLGHALVAQSLSGFCRAGVERVYLEVTAENSGAVRLYRDLGFQKLKVLYKAVDG
jgi:ribosomal protein S18 acetylase RimI-like enzyme